MCSISEFSSRKIDSGSVRRAPIGAKDDEQFGGAGRGGGVASGHNHHHHHRRNHLHRDSALAGISPKKLLAIGIKAPL